MRMSVFLPNCLCVYICVYVYNYVRVCLSIMHVRTLGVLEYLGKANNGLNMSRSESCGLFKTEVN